MAITEFSGKVALVTGASSGIGRSSAIAFARRGAQVIGIGLDQQLGEETIQLVRDTGSDGIFLETDVSQASEVERALTAVRETFGRLDFAFNNAGVEGSNAQTADFSEEQWDHVININLKGVWLSMKYEIPLMLETGSGSIVNCASIAGEVGIPGSAPYVASKHGIIGLTKTAALEYAEQNLRINAVSPGVIHTPMVDRVTGGNAEALAPLIAMEPMGRMGTPEEVAEAVVWLCSEGSGFVTGISLLVDGGWLAGYRFQR